jgi:hypothetical protein
MRALLWGVMGEPSMVVVLLLGLPELGLLGS